VLSTLRPPGAINTVPPDRVGSCETYHGSKWPSLLMARVDDEMFVTRSLNVTPKRTEQRW